MKESERLRAESGRLAAESQAVVERVLRRPSVENSPSIPAMSFGDCSHADPIVYAQHLIVTVANAQAEAQATRARVRETVARARNSRQVVLLHRAVRKRLADLAAERASPQLTE